jgi:hypothetical protein
VPLKEMKETFEAALTAPVKERGYELRPEAVERKGSMGTNGGIEMDMAPWLSPLSPLHQHIKA